MLTGEERQSRLEEIAAEVRVCEQCRLSGSRRIAVPGEGPLVPELLWLGEAPGEREDATGRPFVGPAGSFLRREMSAAGLEPDAAFLTNVVKCRPPGNRAPRADEVAICTTLYLARQIELLQPLGIVVLGSTAAEALLADRVKMTEDHGVWRRDYNLTAQEIPVFVTYHPAAALRNERWRAELRADLLALAASMARALQPSG